ncbi:MAG: dihydropteroate synthase, partial [Pseudomonadota bacterium]
MRSYYRPLIEGPGGGGLPLAGGWARFSTVERRRRDGSVERLPADQLPEDVLNRLTTDRTQLWSGMTMDRPQIMGILNTTPDSFSDGGAFLSPQDALAQGHAMAHDGADLIDIGGESTRPGADPVTVDEERARIRPVVEGLRHGLPQMPLSIDTRKPHLAAEMLKLGAQLYNDVSALSYDFKAGLEVLKATDAPICLMHSSATPDVMQNHTTYEDVVLDVYDWLEAKVDALEAEGIARSRMILDPGIGFGKTLEQNLALLHNLSLFHGLGCPLLLGASRKRFIGTLTNAPTAQERIAGSLAVALEAARQGVHILRVHDVRQTA